MKLSKREKRARRHKRVRAKIKGTAEIPRVSVFRSSRRLAVQFVDDVNSRTILGDDLGNGGRFLGPKTQTAGRLGETLAKKAKKSGITKVVFDRGGYKYHGRVKALAEGLKKGGLVF